MKVEMSEFLKNQKSQILELKNKLEQEFKYVSILGVDSEGTSFSVKKKGASVQDSRWNDRGFVVRVYNGEYYSEYSFNEISEGSANEIFEDVCKAAKSDFAFYKNSNIENTKYEVLKEEEIKDSFFGEVDILPENVTAEEKITRMNSIMNSAFEKMEDMIDFRISYQNMKVCKFFVSKNKDLEQAYIYSEGAAVGIAGNDNGVKFAYKPSSGLKGVEILDEIEGTVDNTIEELKLLLTSENVVAGEYDIICDPTVSGLIAHEAFGHGVEMDMYVKNRAKAVEYMNDYVASEIVNMRDGAKSAVEVSSYLFDDEGTLGTDTKVIENGILKSGISDSLSALVLGTVPTGNGKRQSFERKAYSRMTNTFFETGNDSLEDMISSIKKGYLLEGFQSGMEDPKNWGIQCVIQLGKEIIDGKLTGKIVSPVYLTGYVPDLLKSITMVSKDFDLSGSGYCGKGYKEFVKTSTGGPYIKAKGRLG